MPVLEPDAYADFNRMLDELGPEIDDMKETPRNFLRDMTAKKKQYGEGVFVSPKQLAWIKQLHEEFVGNTVHEQEQVEAHNGDPRDADGW